MKTIKPRKERFEIKEKCDIKIDAGSIFAENIKAGNIDAWNIDAQDINAKNIKAGNIDAYGICAENIDSLNIIAWNIDAENIDAKSIFVWNIVQVHGTKVKVSGKLKAKLLVVNEDCKIDVEKKNLLCKIVRLD